MLSRFIDDGRIPETYSPKFLKIDYKLVTYFYINRTVIKFAKIFIQKKEAALQEKVQRKE